MPLGPSREQLRKAEQEFVTRAQRHAIDAEAHSAAEGIERTPRPDPADAVPKLMSVSLLAAVANAILKGLSYPYGGSD